MKKRRDANAIIGLAALMLSIVLGGCTEPVNWWQPQKRAEPPPPPAETTDAVDPATVGAPDEIRSLDGPAADAATPAPDSLEERIRAYLEQFPESGGSISGAAATPDGPATGDAQAADGPTDAAPISDVGVPVQSAESTSLSANAPAEAAAPAHQPPSFQAAPTLESLSIEPDHLAAPPAPAGEVRLASTSTGAANTGASVAIQTSEHDVNVMIQRLEKTIADNPNDLDAQVRLRLLYLVAGREEDAQRDPQGLSAEKAAMIRQLVQVLTETRTAAANLDLGADGALAAVNDMRTELRRFADLAIPRLILCSRVDSFGAYTPIEPPSFLRGAPVAAVVYCELTNYASRLDDDGQHVTHLSQRIELLDTQGKRVWLREEQEIVDRCRNKREDFFLAPVVQVRENLPAGSYNLRVEIQDRESGKVTSATTPLTIVEPITGLTAEAATTTRDAGEAARREEPGVLRAPS